MRVDISRYDDLLHSVYDCALEPSGWSKTIGAIAEVFGASKALIYTFMHGPARGGFCFTHNLPQEQLEAWAEISQAEDPYVQAVLSRNLLVDGAVYEGCELVPHEQLIQTRLYREIWVPRDIEHVCVNIIFAGADTRKLPTAMSLYRSKCEATFGRAELDLLRRLVVHLSRALGVMYHLTDDARQIASTRAALDRLGSGVVLIDGRGGVQFANLTAQSLFRQANKVRLVSGGSAKVERLAPASRLPNIERAFRRAVDDAIAPLEEANGEHFSSALILPDGTGKPACVMHAAPLGRGKTVSAGGGLEARAIVFFYDLGSVTVAAELLRQLFGLTPAEARAAQQVLEGGSADEMAARLGVSVNTFKTQLKAAYAKTNTSRQVDLLKLMLALKA
jgi:DNA-binding CsgD family transcriptional regulator/PAS domain-containing protein